MKFYFLYFVIVLFSSCVETRTRKYYGADELVVGRYEISLFENKEFYLEISFTSKEGTYTMSNDTIKLKYYDEQDHWPSIIIMSKKKFTMSYDDKVGHELIITRYQ